MVIMSDYSLCMYVIIPSDNCGVSVHSLLSSTGISLIKFHSSDIAI